MVVHAGIVPSKRLNEQAPVDMVSMRNVISLVNEDTWESTDEGTSGISQGLPWASLYRQGPHIYFGHDARRGLQLTEHATGLDTGCVYGKRSRFQSLIFFQGRKLSTVILPGKEIIQVDAAQVYSEPKGND